MNYEEITAEVKGLGEIVTGRMAGLEAKLAAQVDRFDQIEAAFKRMPLGGADIETKEPTLEAKAFSNFLRKGPDALPEVERKSLTVGSNTDGGYLVAPQFEREILKNIVQISPVRQAARVGQMYGSEIIIPKRKGAPTGSWVGETQSRSSAQSEYGQVTIPAFEQACYVDVSIKLLEDSAFAVDQEIAFDLGEEFARMEGAAFVNGSVNKPEGILTNADVTALPSGLATAITADALIDAFYNLPAFYRNQVIWLLNGTTLAAIRKMKDGDGQYLWQRGIALGQPASILGRPVIEAVDMPDVAAGTYPIVLGAFNLGYRVYDRVGTTILRDPYSGALDGLVRFHARKRVGGAVVKPEAFRKLKIAVSV